MGNTQSTGYPPGCNEWRKIDLKQGMTLKSATSDLVLSSRENMLIDQVTLDVENEVAVRGLKDVDIKNATMGANMKEL